MKVKIAGRKVDITEDMLDRMALDYIKKYRITKGSEIVKLISEYKRIFNKMSTEINVYGDEVFSLKYHKMLDTTLEASFKLNHPFCSKVHCNECFTGNCCRILVCISKGEALRIIKYVKQNNIKIDKHLLKKQYEFCISQEVFNEQQWIEGLSRDNRKCIFLDERNRCSIYEIRPTACRAYFTINDGYSACIHNRFENEDPPIGAMTEAFLSIPIMLLQYVNTIVADCDYLVVHIGQLYLKLDRKKS